MQFNNCPVLFKLFCLISLVWLKKLNMSKRRMGKDEPSGSKSTKRKRILIQNDDDSSSDEEADKVLIIFLLFLDFHLI